MHLLFPQLFSFMHMQWCTSICSLQKFQSIFSVCLEQFGGEKLQKMFKNDDFALKRGFWSFSGLHSVPMWENMNQKNSEYGTTFYAVTVIILDAFFEN